MPKYSGLYYKCALIYRNPLNVTLTFKFYMKLGPFTSQQSVGLFQLCNVIYIIRTGPNTLQIKYHTHLSGWAVFGDVPIPHATVVSEPSLAECYPEDVKATNNETNCVQQTRTQTRPAKRAKRQTASVSPWFMVSLAYVKNSKLPVVKDFSFLFQ